MTDKAIEALSDDALRAALRAIQAQKLETERKNAELQHNLRRLQEEQALLERLLQLRSAPVDQVAEQVSSLSNTRGAEGRTSAVDAAVEELEKIRHPLHISELLRLLRVRGTPLPGAGLQANLITYLTRDERVARVSRGMYALRAWGLQETVPTARRRRRKRLRATARQQGAT